MTQTNSQKIVVHTTLESTADVNVKSIYGYIRFTQLDVLFYTHYMRVEDTWIKHFSIISLYSSFLMTCTTANDSNGLNKTYT